jgi:formylglycine-generating enzyme required for sulfatase activity
MDFLQQWKTKLKIHIKQFAKKPKKYFQNNAGPILYSAIASMAFQEAATALAGGNPVNASLALLNLAGMVGAGLIGDMLKDCLNKDENQTARIIETEIKKSRELQSAVDNVMEKLDVVPQLVNEVKKQDRQWFADILNEAMNKAGSRIRVDMSIHTGDKSPVSGTGPAVTTDGNGISVVDSPGAKVTVSKDKSSKEKIDDTTTKERYLQSVLNEHGYIKLFGFLSDANIPVNLLHVFISLQLSDHIRDREHIEIAKSTGPCVLSPQEAIERTIKEEKSLLVLGGPGYGKTTLLKYYAFCSVDQSHWERIGLKKALIPILVSLREIDSRKTFTESLSLWATKHNMDISSDLFEKWLHKPGCLVLLDGLDEVSNLKKRIEICKWIDKAVPVYGKSTFVVTCRFTGYKEADGVSLQIPYIRADVKELNIEQQRTFFSQWFKAAHLAPLSKEEIYNVQLRSEIEKNAADDTEGIMDFLAKEENRSLRDMVSIPVLLQIMAIIWKEQGSLSGDRIELYSRSINYLLDHRDRKKGIEPLMSASKARLILRPLALVMQERWQKDEAHFKKIKPVIHEKLQEVKPEVTPEEFLINIRDRAGVLVGAGAETYTFQHKSFREFLAALEINNLRRVDLLVDNFGKDWWRETILFSAGIPSPALFPEFLKMFLKSKKNTGPTSPLLLQTVQEAAVKPAASFKETIQNMSLDWQQRYNALHCLKLIGSEQAKDLAFDALRDSNEKVRNFARQMLVGWGTLEEKDINIDAATELPVKITNAIEEYAEYIMIPAGRFRMGDTGKEVNIKDSFYLAKFPVTNRLYKKFVKEKGYDEPWSFNEKRFSGGEQPVVGVNYYNAVKYCEWLNENNKDGHKFRLPKEEEWEWAAARGKREYPWGTEKPDYKRANYNNKVGYTTPVGSYPDGATPDGLMDMAGNVWEWTDSIYQVGEDWRVLRGGSFFNGTRCVRCACRFRYDPYDRYSSVGFRLVLSPFFL